MIQVSRGAEPAEFSKQTSKWWEEFQQSKAEAKAKGQSLSAQEFWSKVRKRKMMKSYASQLHQAFHGKCAFCESLMAHITPSHIEHFRPKSIDEFQELMFSWNNWLLACVKCNTNKGTYFEYCNDRPCLIDPTSEDPNEHISFTKSQILKKTERGEKTAEKLRLSRIELVQERTRWLMTINSLLILIANVLEVRSEVRELLIWAMQHEAPYVAMTRAYLKEKTPKLANPDVPHPIIQLDNPLSRISRLLENYSDVLQQLT